VRVVIIAPPWVPVPPPAYGGTETMLDTLARGLQSAGHGVLLVTTGDSTCPVPSASVFDEALGVGVFGSAAEIRHVYHAYDAAVRYRADIVHDHTLVGPIYALQHPDLAVLTTNHGPFDSDLGDVYRALHGRVPVVAISHDQASRAGDVPVAAVIHHGVTPEDYPVGDGAGGFALFLGRMHPDKGVESACRVARLANVPLKIAAKMREPFERTFFEARIRPLLGQGIEYLGEVDGPMKRRLLGAAQCLLNPIAWPEPFGMVMIEALACGTPVVARPVGAAPEIVLDGVTGALALDDDDLAAAVKDAAAFSRGACRRDVEMRFSAERMVDEHVALYQSIVRSRHDPRSRHAA
jgi:glycosyltransferase involved in cell wall biosynthesis